MILNLSSHKGEKPPGRIRKKNEALIIAAAEQEFAANGYEGATMDNIAKRAGIPRPNLHYYYENKLRLYAEILTAIIDLWDHALNEIDPEEAPATALRAYITKKMQFSRDYPLASRIFAKEILSGAPRLTSYFDGEYNAWFKRKTKVFRTWAKQGKMKPIDPAHLMFLIWSATQHYADFGTQISAAMGKEELSQRDLDKATDTLVEIIVDGIGAR